MKQTVIESLIIYLVFDLVILRLILGSFLIRQKNKGKSTRYLIGVALTFTGILLTSFGFYLATPPTLTQGWVINEAMLAGILPFLCGGIGFLVLGIFLINNP